MNIVISFFKKFGALLKRAFEAAEASGLNDKVVAIAEPLVREAAERFVENTQRREWVVAMLVAKGIPESIARLAVELAVQLVKRGAAPKAA